MSGATQGALGRESRWLNLAKLLLVGERLLIADASFVPRARDGLLVDVAPGKYAVQVKVIKYATEERVSRLRAFRTGTRPRLGPVIGTTWTDTGQTGLCAYETFRQAWGDDDEGSYAVISPALDRSRIWGCAILDSGARAIMPFVSSGFGDGEFSVYELLSGAQRVGVEIEFISPGTPYPFP